MEYLRKLRDVKYYETITELIAKQFEIAKLDEARQGEVIQVADVAVPPDKKSSPPRTLLVLLLTLVAFVAACGWSPSPKATAHEPEPRRPPASRGPAGGLAITSGLAGNDLRGPEMDWRPRHRPLCAACARRP